MINAVLLVKADVEWREPRNTAVLDMFEMTERNTTRQNLQRDNDVNRANRVELLDGWLA